MKIAIIGSGIAGLTAAYVLGRRYPVDVFEKEGYAGGHAHTVDATGPNGPQPVDTGFIVYNEVNYPHFTRLLRELSVETLASDMSFGVHSPSESFAYSSRGVAGLLATPQHLLSPRIFRMVRDIIRFNGLARTALENGDGADMTLRDFLGAHRFSDAFIQYYITPMSSAIWSAAPGRTLAFPALTFFRFFNNHGLLSITPDIPWRTIKGGSRSYVTAMTRTFKDRLHLNTPVRGIRRADSKVYLSFDDGPDRVYDRVVIAAHADQALQLLADPSEEERRLLSLFPYQKNRVVLHNDSSMLPRRRAARAAWNVRVPESSGTEAPLTMSYDMNRLQQIAGDTPYLVTLNPGNRWLEQLRRNTNGTRMYFETVYEHPAFIADSFRMQSELTRLNGPRNTYFCGAWFGYGFHEDGVVSGLNAARAMGVDWS
jgi:uncharacterized protein